MSRSLYGERSPAPQVIARRTLDLHLGRVLEVSAIEDAPGHVDIWLRVRTSTGKQVGHMHVRLIALRDVSDLLAGLAAELGVAP